MTGTINTIVNVSFTSTGSVQYSPGSQIIVPPGTTMTVTWRTYQAGPQPMPAFVRNSIRAEGADAGKVTFDIPPGPGKYVSTFDSKFDNSAGTESGRVDAIVNFSVVDPLDGPEPPGIESGGSIRDKGTSIGTRQLGYTLAALIAGCAIGYVVSRAIGSPSQWLTSLVAFGAGLVFHYLVKPFMRSNSD